MGPTASGKTSLALKLATHLPIEVISVDSALIYRDMNIGTAKPTLPELQQVKHYLIDIISPLETYSVAQFLFETNLIIRDILHRNKVPVLVGGTMMYYNALINGISNLPESDSLIRNILEQKLHSKGLDALYKELQTVDFQSTLKINVNDKQRIIRALEVFYISGKPISALQKQNNQHVVKDINFLSFAIIPEDRSVLHNRINARFDKMINEGFIEEVKQLRDIYPSLKMSDNSMRCVGYKEVWQYLDKQISYNDMLEMGKAATRQLAKRQITWLRSLSAVNLAVGNNQLIEIMLLNKLLREVL